MKTVNTNKSVDTSVEEEQEDIALMVALQSGLATEDEKRDFESWLFTIER